MPYVKYCLYSGYAVDSNKTMFWSVYDEVLETTCSHSEILYYIAHMYMHLMTVGPVTKPEKPKANKRCADLKEFYEYQQALANWSVDDGRVNYDNCHLYLWKAMSQFPIMAEARSRVIVPRALHFIKSVIPHTLHAYYYCHTQHILCCWRGMSSDHSGPTETKHQQ